MNIEDIRKIAFGLLGQLNVAQEGEINKAFNVFVKHATKVIFTDHNWTFLRRRTQISPFRINPDCIDYLDASYTGPQKQELILNWEEVFRTQGGANAFYKLPHPVTNIGYLHIYHSDWSTILDFNSNRTKYWWIIYGSNDDNIGRYTQHSDLIGTILIPVDYIGKLKSINLEYTYIPQSVGDITKLYVPSLVELCIAYYIAHIASVSITGSQTSSTRHYQLYNNTLVQAKAEDNRKGMPAQILTLSKESGRELLGKMVQSRTNDWMRGFSSSY